jgi:hypothetical protein
VLDNGFVGIGTGSAQYTLDLYGGYHQYQVQGELARYDVSSANANQNRGVWSFFTNAATSPDFFGRFGFKFEGGTADSFKQFQIHVADSTTPKLVVDGSGRVGIGTITPSASLHISGASSANLLRIESPASSSILFVSGSGNVGIGTTTPYSRFTTYGALSTSTSQISIINSEGGHTILRTGIAGLTNSGFSLISADLDGTNQNTRLVISSAGNVGIGTTAPSARLQVKGSGTTSATTAFRVENANTSASLTILDDGTSAFNTNQLYISSSGRVAVGTLTPQRLFDVYNGSTSGIVASFGATFANGNFSGISFGYVEQANALYRKSALVFERTETHGGGSNASGKIHFLLNNSISNSATALTDAVVTIDSVGSATGSARMGIGTRFPTASLHISGTVATDNLMRVQSTTGAEYFFISSLGNVGIGTINPQLKLDVSGSVNVRSAAPTIAFDRNSSYTWRLVIGDGGTYPLSTFNVANNAGTSVATFLDSGNVGIGETSPGARLEVKGAGATSATTTFLLENSTPSVLMRVLDNGQFTYSGPLLSLASSQSAFVISQSISQSVTAGAQVYGVNITPTFFAVSASQTETAFRVNATFTGSATPSSPNNIIADFGAVSAGSQLTVTDVTSGSIYMVSDVSGLPIIEATSDWTVNMYNFPNIIFQKTGSNVNITGSLNVTGSLILTPTSSFVLPLTASLLPQTGSAFWSGSFLYVYNGTRYMSSSFA